MYFGEDYLLGPEPGSAWLSGSAAGSELGPDRQEDCEPTPGLVAARAIVSVLLGRPLPWLSPAGAQHAGPGEPGEYAGLAQVAEPLTYQELAERFVFDGRLDPDDSGRRPQRPPPRLGYPVLRRREKSVRAPRSLAPLLAMATPHPPPEQQSRPGRGGRQTRTRVFDSTTAISQLRAEIGPPLIDERDDRVGLHYWRLDESAQGVALARLSSREIQKGETVLQQILAIRGMCSQLRLKLGHMIVTTDNSGSRRFEARPDLVLLEELIRAGEVKFLCALGVDRLSRDNLAGAMLEDLLRQTDTDLYLCRLGGRVEWGRDKLIVRTEAIIAEQERENILTRTERGLVTGRIAEGRGRPGAYPFGFYWDDIRREVRVDSEQWPFVVMIHEGYRRLCGEGQAGSLNKLTAELRAAGCPMSRTHVRNILRNPMYVTGERTVKWRDYRVTTKPVSIKHPIPLDLFQSNQEALALNRGPHRTTPVGYYPFNLIRLEHEACADERVGAKKGGRPAAQVRPLLRGKPFLSAGRRPAYGHYPASPACCRGYTIPQEVIEPPIMRALLRLAESRELQDEWRRAPRTEPADPAPMLEASARAAAEHELAGVQSRLAALKAEWGDNESATAQLDPREYLALVEPLTSRIAKLERRLAIDEKLATRRAPKAVATELRGLTRAVDLDDDAVYAELLERLRGVLTEEPPQDPELLRQRAAVVQASLSSVLVRDVPGGFTLELRGPLVPSDADADRPIGPIASASQILLPRGSTGDGEREPVGETVECPPGQECPAEVEPFTTHASSERFSREAAPVPFARVAEIYWLDDDSVIDWLRRRAPTAPAAPAATGGASEWVSDQIMVEFSRLPQGGEERLATAISAVREAAGLLGPGRTVTYVVYRDLRSRSARQDALPPADWISSTLAAQGMSWADLRALSASRSGLRHLREFIDKPLNRGKLYHSIRRGWLVAERRPDGWYTTAEQIDRCVESRRRASEDARIAKRRQIEKARRGRLRTARHVQ